MDAISSTCCLLCGDELDGNGDVASPDKCSHIFHLVCVKNWADIKLNAGHPVVCPLQSCLKAFQSIAVKKNSNAMKVVNVIPIDQDWNCPICLNPMSQVSEIGNPEVCNHHFCLSCLLEWSQTNTSCPLDRMEFRLIFVKNAVGGAVQRRVRTPQRDLRDEIADAESEDTEDDVEVTVANAVSNSLVEAANELMRNRLLHTNCPVCHLTAGPDGIVCSSCNNAYHRQCARVRVVRGDDWRCSNCRSRRPPVSVRRRNLMSSVEATFRRGRRNAVVFNEWHGNLLDMLGNTNYRSSDDDTFSCDTDAEADDDVVSDANSVPTLDEESDLEPPPPRVRNVVENVFQNASSSSNSDSDDVDAHDGVAEDSDVSDDDDSDSDTDDTEVTRERLPRRRTRQTVRRNEQSGPVSSHETMVFSEDLFSRFSSSSSNSSGPEDEPLQQPTRRENDPQQFGRSIVNDTETTTSESSRANELDGRRSRTGMVSYGRIVSSESSVSSSGSLSGSERLDDGPMDSDETDNESVRHPLRLRRTIDRDEESPEQRPKRRRVEASRSRPVATSRPRRLAAPVDLHESSFHIDESPSPPPPPSRRAQPANRGRNVQGSTSQNRTVARNRNQVPREGPGPSTSRASTSRGRGGAASGSARTSGKRKKKTKRRAASTNRRKSSVKKHKTVLKARRRQKKAQKQNRQPTIRVSTRFPNRSESTETAPRLSLLGEGRFPSGPYDILPNTRPESSADEVTASTSREQPSSSSSEQNVVSEAPVSSVISSGSGFLSGLLESQSRLFTPTKYLRVNASDGSLFAVSREQLDADLVHRSSRRPPSSPPSSESPPSANEMKSPAVEASTSRSPASDPFMDRGESSREDTEEQELIREKSPEQGQASLIYSPVVECPQRSCSDVEVDSTPLTDISTSTLGGCSHSLSYLRGHGATAHSGGVSQGDQSFNSSPGDAREEPSPIVASTTTRASDEIKRADFGTRREFESAVANIAKRTVATFYVSRVLSKEEYKAQLKRIVHKVSSSGHTTHKVKNIISLAEKCVQSYIKARSHGDNVKKC